MPTSPASRESLVHTHGELAHEHRHGDHDHDHHEHPAPDQALLELIDGLERHTLHSVGIDIGSSTSHLVLSRLVIQRRGSELSAEFVVSERETVHRSPIWLTPYLDGATSIDIEQLQQLFEAEYRRAGIWPSEVDTGAVVITGEALRKDNAEQIARLVAGWSGEFICVSAGPNHEALLAAHGSGSMALSEAEHATVVNVDIGGGTTKISVIRDGVVSHLEAFSVGARLVAFTADDRISRLEDAARLLLRRLGLTCDLGDVLPHTQRRQLADLMARVVVDRLTGAAGDLYPDLLVASDGQALPLAADIDHIVFSGGVSEFLGDHPPAGFGDLGAELGTALRHRLADITLADRVHPPTQGIRATVMGASQFTVQASGQTCYLSSPDVLPLKGLTAISLDFRERADLSAIRAALARYDRSSWADNLAAVVALGPSTGYHKLRQVADALITIASEHDPTGALVVVLRDDLAHSLGALLKEELGWAGRVFVVDGITVGDLDHVDIGRPLGISGSVPVTVTSLDFPTR